MKNASAVTTVGRGSRCTRWGTANSGSTRSPVSRNSKKANARYVPMAAWAKLTTPEDR